MARTLVSREKLLELLKAELTERGGTKCEIPHYAIVFLSQPDLNGCNWGWLGQVRAWFEPGDLADCDHELARQIVNEYKKTHNLDV